MLFFHFLSILFGYLPISAYLCAYKLTGQARNYTNRTMRKIIFTLLSIGFVLTACRQQNQKEADMDFTDGVKVALSDSGRIDLNSLQWTREPAAFEVKNGSVVN